MNLTDILDKVISIHFKNHDFNHKGKIEWYPVTEKQKKRYFEKKGKELTKQRFRYSVIENFNSSHKSDSSDYRQLLISEIEDDGIFYCIYDYITMGRMGQKTRYKFQIKNFQKSMNLTDLYIELLDNTMIMIR
ncbi:hypothetical protein N9M11_00025 [Flavobacteriaceae bacterium]|uniref:hypothetical protein n=1 Tax=Candidatus Arcticimaribacter forsetii TaxID=2820661 RepID=UPI0020778B90|nr:hypothetical protein [Candidatus Arcticimaribacter forsetii]MDA8698496.1 hypothetical protein [Flavobacteriaceae bacterium]MDB2345907.1 hypothetical protein [Flavobacteriaceae bacterium]MDB4620870.1 hypothetical protein [Flavobacteriaceae bacterium]MDB4738460.1 hypothetical protein [Flavobacteriaceae bacterium]MDC0960372.1 hypothetical protein [Flavobacteriaceae bacterium]